MARAAGTAVFMRALSAIALVVGAGCTGGSEPHDAAGTNASAATMPTTTAMAPAVTTASLPPSTSVAAPLTIRTALAAAGATMNQAPVAIAALLDASTCGLVRITKNTSVGGLPGVSERRCFLDALVTRRSGSLVTIVDSVEGAPTVRTDVVLADASVATFTDSTRDPLSSRAWSLGRCERVTAGPEGLRIPDATWYELDTCSPVDAIAPAPSAVPPDFIARRSDRPLCGYELSRNHPNTRARQCFRDTVVNGSPAEFVFVNPNASGRPITYWQRTTGTGAYEILVHYQPQADSSPRTWVRMDCSGFSILGSASPVVVGAGCRTVESVQT